MLEEHSKKISLTINHRLLTELYKLVGKQQFIRGERITITEFINSILAEYMNSQRKSETLLTGEEEECTILKH